MKEWWLLRQWADKPGPRVRVTHIKTIRDIKEIKSLSYLRSLPIGWYTIQYVTNKKGRFKPYSIKTFWHIKIDPETKQIYAERWAGKVGDLRFVRRMNI